MIVFKMSCFKVDLFFSCKKQLKDKKQTLKLILEHVFRIENKNIYKTALAEEHL